ncbi:MAG: ATP-binding protein, partial [Candidatus Falkowbacteria bacterium]|nr:ATP-binding protein [Candidatus Falkowbacteria bacterium]
PVVAVTGPRQSGKTTLCKAVFKKKPYVLLEEIDKRDFANSDPRGFLAQFPDGAILDEIQYCPALFSYLQGVVDKHKKSGMFILTGSEQLGLVSKITQSLAGRVGFLTLLPFSFKELKDQAPEKLDEILFKGSYPPIYDRSIPPSSWYANYTATYIERDVRQLINVRDLSLFQKFVRLCAGRVGQILNLSSLANDCGITHNTAQSWISILEASYIIFLLRPYYKNFGKRLIKSPKLYFYDVGLLSWFLNIKNFEQVAMHSARGFIFENFIISEMLKNEYNQGKTADFYFWRDSVGNEIDLIIEKGEKLMPIEIKSGQTVNADYFSGMQKWLELVKIAAINPRVVFGGNETRKKIEIELFSWKDSLLAK